MPPPQQAGMNGSMAGSEDLRGYGVLEFRFQPNGQVAMIDADGTQMGTYARAGNGVILRFYGGTVVYTGTFDGQMLAGTANNGKDTCNFSVTRR
jgi:hypothetical protein